MNKFIQKLKGHIVRKEIDALCAITSDSAIVDATLDSLNVGEFRRDTLGSRAEMQSFWYSVVHHRYIAQAFSRKKLRTEYQKIEVASEHGRVMSRDAANDPAFKGELAVAGIVVQLQIKKSKDDDGSVLTLALSLHKEESGWRIAGWQYVGG